MITKKPIEKKTKKKPVAVKKVVAKPKKAAVKHEVKPKKEHKIEAAPKVVSAPHHEEHKAEARVILPKKPPKRAQFHGTGGRKTSKARVWLSEGTGKYMINGRPMDIYVCKRKLLEKMAMEPFVTTNTVGKFDVNADAFGGGICSQVGAVRQAVSVAMMQNNIAYRPALKKQGLLTRDPREKERKKYGQKKARKRFQYSKR